jgi:CubicO group peptidase (beta-lactamase class C family)
MSQETVTNVLHNVDEHIIAAMNDDTLTGLAIGIVHEGTLAYARGFGLADTKKNQPVTPDTVFRIGSISKTLTAVGLMQLWEQGKFQLDDSVNAYLKAYRVEHPYASAPAITFRHLLTHTSGIGSLRSIKDLSQPGFGLSVKKGSQAPRMEEYYGGRLIAEVYPQMKFAYSNHGFATLAQLIEDISGESFESYMMTHVLEPLGMMHTDYRVSERIGEQLAQGYMFWMSKLRTAEYEELIPTGAGGVLSSAHDMARYMIALLEGGSNEYGQVLKPDTLRLMMEEHYHIDTRLPAMGLSFFLEDDQNHRLVWHDGQWHGFSSSIVLAPDHRSGVVVLTNTLNLASHRIAREVMQRLLRGSETSPTLSRPTPDVLETPHLWPSICGSYGPDKGWNTNALVWALLGGEVEIFVKDHHLNLRSLAGPLSKGVRLYPVDADDPLDFQTDPEAKILWPPAFSRSPLRLVFKSNVKGEVDRLCVGLNMFYKRPLKHSLRFKAMVGLGVATGVVALLLGRGKKKGQYTHHRSSDVPQPKGMPATAPLST